MTTLDRRALLKSGAAVTAGTVLASTGTQALAAHAALAHPGQRGQRGSRLKAPNNGGYGELYPVKDKTTGLPLLLLPEGFEYISFGHAATYAQELNEDRKLTLPTTGSDGFPTPGRHDGMAAFPGSADGLVRLVRNHEQGYSPTDAAQEPEDYTGNAYDASLIGDPNRAYDPRAAGGTTTLTFDTRTMRLVNSFISLNGTSVNCAGGKTPWGSWLTCEETVNGTQNGFPVNHGYVFEVPAESDTPVTKPVPYTAMGRFAHEAVAIDPATGVVYETEDNGSTSGFYRFLPTNPRDLSKGGTLQMLAIRGRRQFDTNTGVSDLVGRPLQVSWVTIEDPDPTISAEATTRDQVFQQGRAQGAASFARLEGCWYDGGSIFFNATSGGDAGAGQVWEYRPRGQFGGQLILLFESPSPTFLDSPDNITVSPRGGLVLCEDGDGDQYVRGLNHRGQIFDFAENNVDGDNNEFAGACFSPDGEVMFVNIQTPGVSFAIRGPWERGAI